METEAEWGVTLERWNGVVETCDLSPAGIERAYDFCTSQVRKWLDGDVIPAKKSRAKMEETLVMLKRTQRIPYSPIWGYATPEQIERLKAVIAPQERERIMAQIKKQTLLRGKVD